MGTDIEGNHIYTDLAKQPHMLVAGTTGSGKSMFLHQAIISLLMKNADIEIYAIDAKQVEFNAYKAIKNFHYITDEVEAVQTLKRLVDIMEGRYKTFSEKGYRDITQAQQSGLNIKPIVCVIDEFADLIMRPEYSKLIESYIVRLAQKSRAAGIHLIIATQRPTADVITGLIKANIPSRVCLHVNSAMESRIVMDAKGGELLIGNGDMLYKSNGSFEPIRLQSCYISADEMRMIGNEIAMYSKQTEPSKAQTISNPTTASTPTTSDIEESNPYDNEIIKKRRNQYNKKSSWIDRFFNR
jgi:S-DNA-T family DNA segregation ATPase FtsK/SpoIIIE